MQAAQLLRNKTEPSALLALAHREEAQNSKPYQRCHTLVASCSAAIKALRQSWEQVTVQEVVVKDADEIP